MSVLNSLLQTISGNGYSLKYSDNLVYDKVIGFKGVVDGVGASTVIQNVAVALAETTNLTVCVLDLHFLFPASYCMLMKGANKEQNDLLTFDGTVESVITQSDYSNIFIAGLYDRTLKDMISLKDDADKLGEIIEGLKKFFDIILVDIGNEMTNFMACGAIKCNKIYTVIDTSLPCMINLQKSVNTLSTLAVSFHKCRSIILNKYDYKLNDGIAQTLERYKLKLVQEIPFSPIVYEDGTQGAPTWGKVSNRADVTEFNTAIDNIVFHLLHGYDIEKKEYTPKEVEITSDIESRNQGYLKEKQTSQKKDAKEQRKSSKQQAKLDAKAKKEKAVIAKLDAKKQKKAKGKTVKSETVEVASKSAKGLEYGEDDQE